MGQIDNWWNQIKAQFKENEKYLLYGVIIFALLAHGYGMANKISYHDDPGELFTFGATFTSGRWFTGILYAITKRFTGVYSLPLLNAAIALLFVGISALFVIRILEIQSNIASFLTGAIMVVFPVVTSAFNYTFMDWVYTFSLLLSVLSAYVIRKECRWWRMALSALLLACSIGIYQAFLAVAVTLLLMIMILKCADGCYKSLAKAVVNGVLYVATLILGLGLWAVIRNILLKIVHLNLSAYQGMNEKYQLERFPERLAVAYREYFSGVHCGVMQKHSIQLFFLLSVFFVIVLVLGLILRNRKPLLRILMLILLCLLPFGMNLVYILSTSSDYLVHTMMLYAQVFTFIFPFALLERYATRPMVSLFATAISAGVGFSLIYFVYLDNAAYMKGEMLQKQAIAYYTELVANIKGTEGFQDNMNIILIGLNQIEDDTIYEMGGVSDIRIVGYDYTYEEMINDYAVCSFMREHIGFGNERVLVDGGEYAELSEVREMPCYPDGGSIQIINQEVIVKLGNEREVR